MEYITVAGYSFYWRRVNLKRKCMIVEIKWSCCHFGKKQYIGR